MSPNLLFTLGVEDGFAPPTSSAVHRLSNVVEPSTVFAKV